MVQSLDAFPSPRARLALATFTLGAYAQVAQALLVRETLLVFYGNEVSLGAFYGGWLLWVAVGAAAAVAVRGRAAGPRALSWLRRLLVLMPALLAGQVLVIRTVRLWMDVPAVELVPFGQLLAATFLVTVPTGVAIGLAFPLACEALARPGSAGTDVTGRVARGVEAVSRVYVLEAVGALAGGILFTFGLVGRVGPGQSLGLVSVALALVALALGAARWVALPVAALGLLVGLPPAGPALDRAMERERFRVLQPGLEWVTAVETRYGHTAVGRRGEQFSRVTDGRVSQSWPDLQGVAQEAAYFYSQAGAPRRVLLFGGLEGGLLAELLRYPVERVTAVEQDAAAFAQLRPYLEERTVSALADPRLELVFGDGREVVNRLGDDADYDLVLVLGLDPSTAHSNRYFTVEFYRALARRMTAPGGVLCTTVSSASNYLGREVRTYGGSVYRTLGGVFAEVALAPGDTQVLCAGMGRGMVTSDPAVLEARYRAVPLAERHFPSDAFADLLPPDRVAFVRASLEAEGGEWNTDDHPVAYYLNMVLWGKLTSPRVVGWLEALRRLGPWPYLVPVGVLALLLPLRAALEGTERTRVGRQAGTAALGVVGFAAMGGQLALLYSYQAHLGLVFGRIALLNAVFMTGLAVGAGLPGRALARRRRARGAFVVLLLLLTAVLGLLPAALEVVHGLARSDQEPLYLLACTGLGLLTGVAYPRGVALAHGPSAGVLTVGGLTQAADQVGGALGGLVAGSLQVPLLGTRGAFEALAGMVALVVLPVAFCALPVTSPAFLRQRGHRAFGWPWLSWTLLGAVVTVGVLTWVAGRGGGVEPLVRFSEDSLAAVSGSQRFELREDPFPHYVGSPDAAERPAGAESGAVASGPARTVSVASGAVTSEVRGHGGPINLLVALDETGRLRGLRLIESHETPAYLEGLDAWLDGLAGADLTLPLDLERYDALSGATVTSRAVLETVSRAAGAAAHAAFGLELAGATPRRGPFTGTLGLAGTALLLAFFYPVYRSGGDRARLAYQAATLAVLGLWLNTLLTEGDLAAIALGRWPGLSGGETWYLLAGFAVVTAVLFGQAYCGYVCPFGALQEFLSRAGRHWRLRRYADRRWDRRLRRLKFILLAGLLLVVWATGDTRWAAFDPMQQFFAGRLSGWLAVVAVASLAGALVYYRFWCRYFCPLGAFFALFNKVAMAARLGPLRRYERCDLGVQDDYDVDCIRCHRCVTGRDFGLRPPAPGRRGRKGEAIVPS